MFYLLKGDYGVEGTDDQLQDLKPKSSFPLQKVNESTRGRNSRIETAYISEVTGPKSTPITASWWVLAPWGCKCCPVRFPKWGALKYPKET